MFLLLGLIQNGSINSISKRMAISLAGWIEKLEFFTFTKKIHLKLIFLFYFPKKVSYKNKTNFPQFGVQTSSISIILLLLIKRSNKNLTLEKISLVNLNKQKFLFFSLFFCKFYFRTTKTFVLDLSFEFLKTKLTF